MDTSEKNKKLRKARGDSIELIKEGQICLAAFLKEKLPLLDNPPRGKTRWEHYVVNHLSPFERKYLKGERIDELDLVGMLRVLKGNWHKIFGNYKDLALVYQMEQIRNDLVNPSPETIREPSAQDIYRKLDALGLFLNLIEGDKSLIQRVQDSLEAIVPLLLTTSRSTSP